MAWIIIGSPGGLINKVLVNRLGLSWLRIDIYSTMGIVWIQVLHITPFAFFTVRAPLSAWTVSTRKPPARPVRRRRRVLRRITLPLLGYSVASSAILTFITSIEQFAIPALIGSPGRINVLATQLYLLVRFSPPDYGLAATIGLTLSAITGLAIWLQRSV